MPFAKKKLYLCTEYAQQIASAWVHLDFNTIFFCRLPLNSKLTKSGVQHYSVSFFSMLQFGTIIIIYMLFLLCLWCKENIKLVCKTTAIDSFIYSKNRKFSLYFILIRNTKTCLLPLENCNNISFSVMLSALYEAIKRNREKNWSWIIHAYHKKKLYTCKTLVKTINCLMRWYGGKWPWCSKEQIQMPVLIWSFIIYGNTELRFA